MRRAVLIALGALLALLLILLLAGWILTRRGIERALERFPARGMFAEATMPDGSPVRLRLIAEGQGEPVVLLHGAFGGVEDFEATLLPLLARTRRVLAYDRPGHGWSDRVPGALNDPGVQAEAIVATLRNSRIEQIDLVGFSYGGSVALTLALRHPQLVRRLVLINTPSHGWGTGTSPVYHMARWPLVGTLFRHTLALPLGSWVQEASIEKVFAPAAPDERFASSPAALALTPERFLANAEDFCVLDEFLHQQESTYPTLRTPTLLLAAPEDRIVGYHIHSRRLESEAPNAKLIALEGNGHALLFTETERLAREIDLFLSADTVPRAR